MFCNLYYLNIHDKKSFIQFLLKLEHWQRKNIISYCSNKKRIYFFLNT